MTTPAEYRRFALDCMREAEGTESVAMREIMIGLSRIWMRTSLEAQQNLMAADDSRASDPAGALPPDKGRSSSET
jgi:hypothetical protein